MQPSGAAPPPDRERSEGTVPAKRFSESSSTMPAPALPKSQSNSRLSESSSSSASASPVVGTRKPSGSAARVERTKTKPIDRKAGGSHDPAIAQRLLERLSSTLEQPSVADVLVELELAGKHVAEVLATADKDGWTPLHLACRYSSPAVVYCLLNAGADARLLNGSDATCLHLLCGRRLPSPTSELAVLTPQLLAELLRRGCRVRAQNSNGETCLHIACSSANAVAAAFLLDVAKLDPSVITRKGLTALDYALHQQSAPLCELLLKHGASAAASLELAQQIASPEPIMALLHAAAAKKSRARDVLVWEEEAGAGRALHLQGAWDVFRTTMLLKRFHVFVSHACKLCVVSAHPNHAGEHTALLVEANAFTLLAIQPSQLQLYRDVGVQDVGEQLRRLLWTLTPSLPEADWRSVSSACLTQGAHLLALEARLCPRQTIAVGVICGRGAQTTEEEMMANTEPSPAFKRFLKIIEGPDRDEAVHATHWKGFSFTFHVAPLLSAEEQRQHIGNAPVLLFFCEDEAQPAPTFRGSVNTAALVAKYNKKADSIMLSGFHRRWVKDFEPSYSSTHAYPFKKNVGAIRNLLFTNVANVFWAVSTAQHGPYAAARTRLFEEGIADLIRLDLSSSGGGGSAEFELNKRSVVEPASEKLKLASSSAAALLPDGAERSLAGLAKLGESGRLTLEALSTASGARDKVSPGRDRTPSSSSDRGSGAEPAAPQPPADVARGAWVRKLAGTAWHRHWVQWDALNHGLCVYKADEKEPASKLLYLPAWAADRVSKAEFDARLLVHSVSGQVHEFMDEEGGPDVVTPLLEAFVEGKKAVGRTRYHEGWLQKRKDERVIASWKRRWFVVLSNGVTYYERPDSAEASGSFSLTTAEVSLSPDNLAVLEVRDKKAGSAHTLAVPPETGDGIRIWVEAIVTSQTMLKTQLSSSSKLARLAGVAAGEEQASSDWPPVHAGQVPDFVRSALALVEQNGLGIEGIFRLSGNQDEIPLLIAKWKAGQRTALAALQNEDIHNVVGALKRYFRDMTPPLCTFTKYEMLCEVQTQFEHDGRRKLEMTHKLLRDIPGRALFVALFNTLSAVAANCAVNKMDAKNCSIVFAPSILRAKDETPLSLLQSMERNTALVTFWIEHWVCCGLATDAVKWSHTSNKDAAPQQALLVPVLSVSAKSTSTSPSISPLQSPDSHSPNVLSDDERAGQDVDAANPETEGSNAAAANTSGKVVRVNSTKSRAQPKAAPPQPQPSSQLEVGAAGARNSRSGELPIPSSPSTAPKISISSDALPPADVEVRKSAGFVRAVPKRDAAKRASVTRKLTPVDPSQPPPAPPSDDGTK